jgi:thymidylate kinase
VIYDRYYFDFINDSKRSNLVLPQGVAKLGYRLLLKPKFNFFLYADPETILQRKKELDFSTIQDLTQRYRQLFHQLQGTSETKIYKSILNEDLNRTTSTILKTLVQY